jgi:hypothetical protein
MNVVKLFLLLQLLKTPINLWPCTFGPIGAPHAVRRIVRSSR